MKRPLTLALAATAQAGLSGALITAPVIALATLPSVNGTALPALALASLCLVAAGLALASYAIEAARAYAVAINGKD